MGRFETGSGDNLLLQDFSPTIDDNFLQGNVHAGCFAPLSNDAMHARAAGNVHNNAGETFDAAVSEDFVHFIDLLLRIVEFWAPDHDRAAFD